MATKIHAWIREWAAYPERAANSTLGYASKLLPVTTTRCCAGDVPLVTYNPNSFAEVLARVLEAEPMNLVFRPVSWKGQNRALRIGHDRRIWLFALHAPGAQGELWTPDVELLQEDFEVVVTP